MREWGAEPHLVIDFFLRVPFQFCFKLQADRLRGSPSVAVAEFFFLVWWAGWTGLGRAGLLALRGRCSLGTSTREPPPFRNSALIAACVAQDPR